MHMEHSFSKIIKKAFIVIFIFASVIAVAQNKAINESGIQVEHVIQGYIGENHLANLVYRKGIEGDRFTGWGRTPVTDWAVGSSSNKRVVPANPDKRYTNGGCAMDIDGDGVDEIITGVG